MKRNIIICLIVTVMTLFSGGCKSARGFDRGALKKDLNATVEITDEEVGRILSLKPQISSPFKLAVFFKPAAVTHRYNFESESFDDHDRELFEKTGRKLVKDGHISKFMSIPSSAVQGKQSLKNIRIAAARFGADAVLIINGVSDSERYNNGWSALYPLIVTGAFIPGTEVNSIFLSNATLWDVRNEYLYASAEAEGRGHTSGPAFTINEFEARHEAQNKSMKALANQINKNIRNLKAK
jgi:rhombotail lipoprotein